MIRKKSWERSKIFQGPADRLDVGIRVDIGVDMDVQHEACRIFNSTSE